MKRIKIFILIFGLFLTGYQASARENVTDWYIKDFESRIVVNKDSSLDITEKITADCGNASGKHGIFRILPTRINLNNGETIKTPVKLESITDFSGKPYKYTNSTDSTDGTVTWKIGDPDNTVKGVNYYQIHYLVENTIRFGNLNFDEFYWNLTGNFWDLEIGHFKAQIIFPEEVNQENSDISYYTGSLGSKSTSLAAYQWKAPNILEFESTGTLSIRQGITTSVTFPKNIFTPYVPGLWEKFSVLFFAFIPFIVFIICLRLWWIYGRDPQIKKTVIAEYEAPGKLEPMELGMLMRNGSFDNKFVTAEIVNLAVKGLIKIEGKESKILLFKSKEYEFTRLENRIAEEKLNSSRKLLLKELFQNGKTRLLTSLKNSFYKSINEIEETSKYSLVAKKLITKKGGTLRIAFVITGIFLMVLSFFTGSVFTSFAISSFFSGLILIVFSFAMPKRTQRGSELNWQTKGFKLFMETVDKDRAKFYEKENIFEKFLPYAIIFGMTGLWIKKMKEIYGEEYFSHYVPAWYAGNMAAFDAESFASTIDSLSSDIASNTSSSSGSGGGGGAGGGGGGGGGGGW